VSGHPWSQRLVAAIAILGGLLAGSPALGSGLILYEINGSTTGTASAGWSALAADASTAFTNPAGMTRLDRSQLLAGVQPLIVDSHFDQQSGTSVMGGGNNGGNAGGVTPSMGGFYVHHIDDDWRVGFSMTSYFGLGIDYKNDWVGRYFVQDAAFITLLLGPSGAYRITDWLSIGGSVGMVYSRLEYKAAIPNFEPMSGDGRLSYDDRTFGVAGSVGLLLEPVENARFGVTYYSPVDLDFKDRPNLKGIGPGLQAILDGSPVAGGKLKFGFDLPQWIMVSAVYEPIEDLALMANVNWQDWSEFGKIDVNIDSEVSGTVNASYKDTWQLAVGAQYRLAESWLLMAGFAYDSSPVNKKHRSVVLPLDRTLRYALGVQYDWSENVTLGLAYEYLDTGSAPVRQSRTLAGTLKGDYSTNRIQVVNANLIWRF